MEINEFWLEIFTQKFRRNALIRSKSDDFRFLEIFQRNLSIFRKNSTTIPKDFLKNSQRNATRDSRLFCLQLLVLHAQVITQKNINWSLLSTRNVKTLKYGKPQVFEFERILTNNDFYLNYESYFLVKFLEANDEKIRLEF
jgi:hypothetical protein